MSQPTSEQHPGSDRTSDDDHDDRGDSRGAESEEKTKHLNKSEDIPRHVQTRAPERPLKIA